MEGAAVHRLGWSISLQYETHDLITVHLNEQVKDLCVYLCKLASSSRIPFSLKTEIFFHVLAYRPRVPVKTVTENAFSKSCPEKRLLKILPYRFRVNGRKRRFSNTVIS